MSRFGIAIICGMIVIACSDSDSDTNLVSVRDSAGVQIVENAGNLWASPLRWSVSPEPVVRIGAVDGDEAYLFDGIRGIVVLSDGRIVVSNSGDRSVRWYDSTGQFLFRRGGSGEGPGEFNYLGAISIFAGDTVVAVDWASQRFITFGPDGAVGPTRRITGLPAPPGQMYRAADDTWVLGISGFSSSQLGDNVEPGVYRLDAPLLRITSTGEIADTIGMFPGSEIEVRVIPTGMMFGPSQLGRRLSYELLNDHVIVGTADRLQYDLYSLDGDLLQSVRAPDVDVRMTPEIEQAYRDFLRESLDDEPPEDRAASERAIADMTLPDSVAAYSTILVDADDRVWVGEARHDQKPAQQYLVFDADGRFIGRAAVPESLRVMAIRDGRVWGRWTDDLGIEYVVAYTLDEEH